MLSNITIQNILTLIGIIIGATGLGIFARRGTSNSTLELMQKNVNVYKATVDTENLQREQLQKQLQIEREEKLRTEQARILEAEKNQQLANIIANLEIERKEWIKSQIEFKRKLEELEKENIIFKKRIEELETTLKLFQNMININKG